MTCGTLSRSHTMLDAYATRQDVPAADAAAVHLARSRRPRITYWYLPAPPNCWPWPPRVARARDHGDGHDRAGTHPAGFLHRPAGGQRDASPHTVAAYRDTLRLLLGFAAQSHRRPAVPAGRRRPRRPADRRVPHHLETERGNSVSTRNARLAAIHSLFRYAALRHPEHAESSRGCWPSRPNAHRSNVCFLTDAEVDALLAAPDQAPGSVAVITPCSRSPSKPGCGSPNSPHSVRDVHLGAGAYVRCHGLSRVRDKPCYAERWFMPSYPASGVDLPCGRGGSRLLSPELLGIIRGRRGRRAACRVPGSGRCWCPAVPCARALVL